jgi:hypothetical protein
LKNFHPADLHKYFEKVATYIKFKQQKFKEIPMFSIEHEFDCTVITILDEGSKQLTEDITVTNFEECTTLEQYDPISDRINKITFSNSQISDLIAAIKLPEGFYSRSAKEK